jgi:tetratricopeptide (TPR) repeat protein
MLLAVLASLSLHAASLSHPVAQTAATPAQDDVFTAKREADVYNYVTARLRLLKRGKAVEELKSEIVDQIDFGAIPPRSVEVLRRVMVLCDKAITAQVNLKQQLAALDAQASQSDKEAVVAVGAALWTGGGAPIVSALCHLPEASAVAAKKDALLGQSAASLGADISTMELDLAIFRSQVQADGGLAPTEFINPADYDQFLEAAAKSQESDRIAGVSAALERSPRMQPAALHLAIHFFQAKDASRCVQCADQVIEGAPKILRRDALRAQAYLFKAWAANAKHDYTAAHDFSELGLKDDPGSPHLLLLDAEAVTLSGNYEAGLPMFEKLTLLLPQNPTVFYDLACCYAIVRKDADAALSNLKLALDRGFSDIEHVKKDADFALLRDRRRVEFQSLTTLSLSLEMEWNAFGSDVVIVANESKFTIEKVKLTLTFTGAPSADRSRKPWSMERTVEIASLAPGKRQRFGSLIDTTRDMLGSIHVVAEGSQGRFESTFQARDLVRKPGQSPRTP